jgi:hypothetical protein
LRVTLEEKVPLLVSGLGTPAWLVEECHRAGTKVMSIVGNVRQARRLEQTGVDIIVAQGWKRAVTSVPSRRWCWSRAWSMRSRCPCSPPEASSMGGESPPR